MTKTREYNPCLAPFMFQFIALSNTIPKQLYFLMHSSFRMEKIPKNDMQSYIGSLVLVTFLSSCKRSFNVNERISPIVIENSKCMGWIFSLLVKVKVYFLVHMSKTSMHIVGYSIINRATPLKLFLLYSFGILEDLYFV